jgi:hypothetical protein
MTQDINALTAAFEAATAEADRLKAIMWRTKSAADTAAFSAAFFRQGDARRALEAATGKSTLNPYAPDRKIRQRDAAVESAQDAGA